MFINLFGVPDARVEVDSLRTSMDMFCHLTYPLIKCSCAI